MNNKSQYLVIGFFVLLGFAFFALKRIPSETPELPSVLTVNGQQQSYESQANQQQETRHTEQDITTTKTHKPSRELPRTSVVENLLKNGNFEQSLDSWDYDTGIFWSSDGGSNVSGGLLLNPPEVISESRIIHEKKVSQCVAIRGNSTYGIEASFRYLDTLPKKSTNNRIHLYWFDQANCSGGGQYGTYLEPNLEAQEWQRLSKKKLRPSLGARSAQIRIAQRQENNNNAEAYWDDVQFFETSRGRSNNDTSIGSRSYNQPIGDNYIKNSTFDSNLNSWAPKRSKRLNWRVDNDPKHGGVIAATLPNSRESSMGTGAFSQCVNLGTHSRYELGAQVRVDSNSSQRGGGRLRATWYEDLDCKGRYRAARHHVDVDRDANDWQDLHVSELTPKAGSKSVSIGIVHSIDGKGDHTLLWDNFYFRAY